jgi:hypothetical protein
VFGTDNGGESWQEYRLPTGSKTFTRSPVPETPEGVERGSAGEILLRGQPGEPRARAPFSTPGGHNWNRSHWPELVEKRNGCSRVTDRGKRTLTRRQWIIASDHCEYLLGTEFKNFVPSSALLGNRQ